MAYSISKASGAINLVDVISGYMIAQWLLFILGISFIEKPLISNAFGIVFGALFFYIAPIENFIRQIYIWKYTRKTPESERQECKRTFLRAYDSSYLLNSKSRIASAFYISIISILFSFFPNLQFQIVILSTELSFIFLCSGILIAICGFYEAVQI